MTEQGYPPIDAELRATVWPALAERAAAVAGMSADDIIRAGRFGPEPAPGLGVGDGLELEETTIVGGDGSTRIPVVILRTTGAARPAPCLFMVAGGRTRQHPRLGLTTLEEAWVLELGITLVSVAPRVGPEDPHPAQLEDARAGLFWAHEESAHLGIDPDRILLAGKGGGGGVAAATALWLRDHGGPALASLMLISPMLDDRQVTVSGRYDVPPWPARNNGIAWDAVLGDAAGTADVSAYAAPARAADVAGLPPTYLETGGSEVMRDEVLAFAIRLAEAGVPVELHMWQGGFHGFDMQAPDAEISRACRAARRSYLTRVLRDTEPG